MDPCDTITVPPAPPPGEPTHPQDRDLPRQPVGQPTWQDWRRQPTWQDQAQQHTWQESPADQHTWLGDEEKVFAHTVTLFPRTALATRVGYAHGLPANYSTKDVNQAVTLDGSPAGTMSSSGYQARNVNCAVIVADVVYASVYVVMSAGKAANDYAVQATSDPTRTASGTITKDMTSWEAGVVANLLRLSDGVNYQADLVAGGGYYATTIESSSTDFALPGASTWFPTPLPGHWETDPSTPGSVVGVEESYKGFYGEVGIRGGFKVCPAFGVSAEVFERLYGGGARGAQTTIGLSFDFSW